MNELLLGKAAEGRRSPRRFAHMEAAVIRASVLDCASPLALCSHRGFRVNQNAPMSIRTAIFVKLRNYASEGAEAGFELFNRRGEADAAQI